MKVLRLLHEIGPRSSEIHCNSGNYTSPYSNEPWMNFSLVGLGFNDFGFDDSSAKLSPLKSASTAKISGMSWPNLLFFFLELVLVLIDDVHLLVFT